MASTSTGTVSLVNVFSALNPVVITRVSIQLGIALITGMIKKSPGPFNAWN